MIQIPTALSYKLTLHKNTQDCSETYEHQF